MGKWVSTGRSRPPSVLIRQHISVIYITDLYADPLLTVVA